MLSPAGRTGISDDVAFATKPELAQQMIARALAAGVRFAWVTGDEAYGQNTALRDWLEDHELAYVMAVPKTFTITAGSGPLTAAGLARLVPAPAGSRSRAVTVRKGSAFMTGPRSPPQTRPSTC